MHQQHPLNFLKHLEVPTRHSDNKPSLRLTEGILDWERRRGDELQSDTLPDYEYLADAYQLTVDCALHHRSSMFDAEFSRGTQDPHGWTFSELEDFPARVLGTIAYEMGWRLVPLAKWAAVKLRQPSFAGYVEDHCRNWCASADTVYRLMATQKLTRANLESQRAMAEPLINEARMLRNLTLRELEMYFNFRH